MYQTLSGSESNLAGYWKLDGDFTDETSNSNDLTAAGGAVATDTDNPMSDTEYGIITDVSYSSPNSTVRVFTGLKHMIPNMTLSSPEYSTQDTPFGFPKEKEHWRLKMIAQPTAADSSYEIVASPAASVIYDSPFALNVPQGNWIIGGSWAAAGARAAGGSGASGVTYLSSNTSSASDHELAAQMFQGGGGITQFDPWGNFALSKEFTLDAKTTFTILAEQLQAGSDGLDLLSYEQACLLIYADCGYL